MNQEAEDQFIDFREENEIMDEEAARELNKTMLLEQGLNNDTRVQIPNEFVKEYKARTDLSIRKIAAITGLNKDKVNNIIRT